MVIVWAESRTHGNGNDRSCPIKDFLPILQVPNVMFYNLQVGDGLRPTDGQSVQEIDLLPPDTLVYDLSERLGNYGDIAVVIDQLDLVITVDTSVAHLAGALGKSVWTLLNYTPDWRWLLDRDDSLWYLAMRLFRQPEPKDWTTVCQQVAAALTE